MLKKKTALIVLTIVMVFALLAGVALMQVFAFSDNPRQPSEGVLGNVSSADTTASAATITAASSFSKFTNGTYYYYTTITSGSTAQSSVYVNTSATWGSMNNPYVISTKEQWQLFVNAIATSGKGAAPYNAITSYYALGADIDLGGCTVDPVGKGNTSFWGHLYGNKHTIKNGTITYGDSPNSKDAFWCSGLFNVLHDGASVYDLKLDSTLKLSVPIATGRQLLVGSLAGWAENGAVVCNVSSSVSITITNTSTTASQKGHIGGLIGAVWGGDIALYKCLYQGNITYQAAGANTGADNNVYIGGLIGRTGVSSNVIIDCCAVKSTITERYDGPQIGAIIGRIDGAASTTVTTKISNVVTSVTVSLPVSVNTPDVGVICGQAVGSTDTATTTLTTTGNSISDIYVIGGNYTNQFKSVYNPAFGSASVFSNIQTCAATSTTISPSSISSKVTKNGSTAATVTKAIADTQVNGVFAISSTGVIDSRLWSCALNFNKGSGSTGGPSNTVYYPSSSAQNITVTAPSRTGYTFKGWSLTGYQGTISGTTSYVTIPANSNSTVTAYAVWEVNAFTGTAPSDVTIVYGSNATFSAAGLSSPPGTSSSTYGVNISYQWKNSAGTAISGATSSTYTLTTPSYTAGTNYQVTVTATPKDGVTAARSTTYTVKLIVKKKGVTVPTAISGLVYNGSQQTGVNATTNSTVTNNKATAAGSYTATASLPNTTNYCWGSDGNTASGSSDLTKSITWSIARATIAVPTISATSFTYNGSNQKPTTSTNSAYTVTNNGGTNVGTYTVTFTLVSTNYQWASAPSGGTVTTAAYPKTFSITKASVAVPSITSATSVVYNAAKQTPTTTTSTLYNVTNAGGTNVGSYSVTFALKDTTNYKWATAPSGGESANYVLGWSITKASITLSAPTALSDSVDGRLYVGQTLGTTSGVTINQNSGGHVRTGSTASVAGNYAWVSNGTKLTTSGTVSLAVSFTPTDTTNYTTPSAINMSVTVIQLKLTVRELGIHFYDASNQEVAFDSYALDMTTAANKDLARTITSSRNYARDVKELNVDYGEAFTLSKLNVARGTTVHGAQLNWQKPVGYNVEYFTEANGDNTGNANKKIQSTTTDAIYVNTTIYLGYTAQPVHYTVVTVKEDLVPLVFGVKDGVGLHGATPTNADIIAHLNGTKLLPIDSVAYKCLEISFSSTAAAGTKVSATAKTIDGFTRKTSLTQDGDSKYISDDSAKFVLGTGDTVLITYYERNKYTVTWNYNGGEATNVTKTDDPKDESIPKVANRLSYLLKYGETFKTLLDPVYDGGQYTFEGWYLESNCINRADIKDTMGAGNVAYYAGRTAEKFKITFDYDMDTLAQELLNADVMPDNYKPARPSDNTAADIDTLIYTVEQIINTGIIRLPTPSLVGFKFVSWVYDDADGVERSISTVTRTTASGPNVFSDGVKGYELRAKWTPITYTIALNTNGGNRVTPSQIKVPNLHNYEDETLSTPRTLPTPTRPGFTFLGWTYEKEPADIENGWKIIPGEADVMFDWTIHGTTLYAQWSANPVKIVVDNEGDLVLQENGIVITSSDYVDSDGKTIPFAPSDTDNQDSYFVMVKKDSVLTITIRPEEGYEISSIAVGGLSYTNGGRFTVRTYDNDELHIVAATRAKTYSINYMWNGGNYRGTEQLNTKYTIEDEEVFLPQGAWVTKTGYVFDGWIVNDPNPDTDADPLWVLDEYRDSNWFPVPGNDLGASRNATLYARWKAAPVDIIYCNDYIQKDGTGAIVSTEKYYTESGELMDYRTGDEIELWMPGDYNPNDPDNSFTPNNRELIGWATVPSGDIAYSVNYTFENDDLVANAPNYTVRANVDNVNRLYAVWRITNVQYVVFEAENNNTEYRDDVNYKGVTLTARPLYAYEPEESLSLKFKWYKVDPSWEKWTDADLEVPGLTDDQKSQIAGYIGMYKIPTSATPIQESKSLTGSVISSKADQCDVFGNGRLKNVSDSGLYICSLTATGSYYTSTEGLKTSTITMYGQYDVIINKTDLADITLSNDSLVYNGEKQNLAVETAWTQNAAGEYNLPDGSRLVVTYTYTNLETGDDFVGGVTDVGVYSVIASFSFANDKGNYNTPEDLYSELEITQRPITEVDYVIETVVDGEWVEAAGFEDNIYTGEEFRIVAKPKNVVNNDDVSIVLFYDGDLTADGKAVNVGNYVAYCDQLAGEGMDNYSLSFNIDGCEFNIIKAKHDIEVTFEDVTTTYDGNFVDMTNQDADNGDIRLVITENGKPVEINRAGNNRDTITLAKGYVITLTYVGVSQYVDASFAPDLDEMNPYEINRGGRDAGEYVITISFADTAANEVNFEAMEDITATLTIKQAKYRSDGVHVGLTDAELNTEGSEETKGDDTKVNPGFGRGTVTVNFNAQTYYDPQIIFADDIAANFEVSYRYEFTLNNSDGSTGAVQRVNSWDDMFEHNERRISASGTYRVTASIAYDNVQYANNYESLPDYTIELKITPGSIENIEVVYGQKDHEDTLSGIMNPITYGDTFDFLDANADGYVVKITAVYANGGGRETISPTSAQFFAEDGVTPFTIFDRATIAHNVATADLDTAENLDSQGDYIVKVKVYGKTGNMEVKVRQKELTYDDFGFDATNDSNIHVSGQSWSYTLSYDGESRFPALANDNDAYNFVGINSDKLTGALSTDTAAANATITAKYQYEVDGNYVDMPENGFVNVGTYNIRVTFTNNNTNYAPLGSDATLDCVMTVSPKLITADDIVWRYSSNSAFTSDKTDVLAQGANLTYCGESGFYVKAVYRNLAVKNQEAGNYYLPVAKIKIADGDEAAFVNIANADSYTISIVELDSDVKNYQLASNSISAKVTIDPAEVDLTWQLTDGVKSLTYNGKNQLATGVTASYDPPVEHKVSKKAVTIKVVGDDPDTAYPLTNAGTYTLSATLADTNYKPTNATFQVTVDPIKVDSNNTTIVWYYLDTDNNEHYIKDDARIIDYVGADVPVYIKYSVQGEDNGDATDDSDPDNTYNYRIIKAASADGTDIHNAGTYDLVGALSKNGNYDLSEVTQKFTIRKKTLTVNWTADEEYTYDGSTREVLASVTPVGKELAEGVTIINVAEASKRDAGEYTTSVSLLDDYVKNYELYGNVDGIVSYEWKINKLTVKVAWDTDSLVYNRGYALNNWSVKVTNIPVGEDGQPIESVDLVYEIYRDEVADANIVSDMTTAGKYIIKVIGATDANYSVAEVANKEVTVAKATAKMEEVVYTEYTDDTTYQGNAHGLRNDKLNGKAVIDGVEVKGTITFVDAAKADLTTVVKNKKFACVFTPDDTDNYNIVNFEHEITVAADEITRVGFDNSTIATTYAVGQKFIKLQVKLFFEYKSYYAETVHDGEKTVIKEYGQHVRIDRDDPESDVNFVFNNIPIDSSTYVFKERDIGENKLISVHAKAPNGKYYDGAIRVNVINAIPLHMTIVNKEELQARDYFVGTKFDKSLLQVYIEYETESSNAIISNEYIDLADPILPSDPTVSYKLTFTYFTNTELQVSDSIEIRVRDKIKVDVNFKDTTIKWDDDKLLELPQILTKDGTPLPEGVSCSPVITDANGKAKELKERGEYTVVLRFTVDSSKYYDIEDITAKITVKEIKAIIDESLLVTPIDVRKYSGKALSSDDYMLKNIVVIDSEANTNVTYEVLTDKIVYTINGRPADSVKMLEAGTYKIVATITVLEHNGDDTTPIELTIEPYSYEIKIEKAENEIDTFVINNWVYGKTPSTVNFHSTFGEADIVYYSLDANNQYDQVYIQLPEDPGIYVAVATVHGSVSYDQVTKEATFMITRPELAPAQDSSDDRESLIDDEGKYIVRVSSNKGVDPSYNLRVEVLKNTSEDMLKKQKQVVLAGYDIDVVDAKGNVIENPGEYTVRLLLTPEQRNSRNVKVYSVDEYGYATEISGATVDEEGYVTFTTSNFNGNFVVGARDAEAANQMWWIIGLSIGGLIALIAIVILIIVVIKKKKEND